jgi:hypothetical protein
MPARISAIPFRWAWRPRRNLPSLWIQKSSASASGPARSTGPIGCSWIEAARWFEPEPRRGGKLLRRDCDSSKPSSFRLPTRTARQKCYWSANRSAVGAFTINSAPTWIRHAESLNWALGPLFSATMAGIWLRPFKRSSKWATRMRSPLQSRRHFRVPVSKSQRNRMVDLRSSFTSTDCCVP